MTETTRTFTQEFEFKLTTEEQVQYSQRLARALGEKAGAEETLKDTSAKLKARVGEYSTQVSELGGTIRRGYVYREVECFERINEDTQEVEEYRGDTGEIFRVRPLSLKERQRVLPLAMAREKKETGQ